MGNKGQGIGETSPRLGESTCRLGGSRHDGKVANPKGGLRHVGAERLPARVGGLANPKGDREQGWGNRE
jgi:hypothetical protein